MVSLRQFAFTSLLLPALSPVSVTDIVRVSRVNNHAAGLTGILVFDGWRFFGYLEGDQAQLAARVARLRGDPRHTDFTPLVDRPLTGPRRFADWVMGYACSADDSVLDDFVRQPTDALLAGLPRLVAGLDLEP